MTAGDGEGFVHEPEADLAGDDGVKFWEYGTHVGGGLGPSVDSLQALEAG